MVQAGDSADALAAARQSLAARDADLADADLMLADAVAAAHALAVDSIGRIEAITAEVEAAAAEQSKDSPAEGREVGRHLLAKNREIAELVQAAKTEVDAKTIALKHLTERYRT